MYGILNPVMFRLMDEVQAGIRYIFQTKNELTFAVNASGMGGMEAALTNLLEPGDKFMTLVNGYWGMIAGEIASRCGKSILIILK